MDKVCFKPLVESDKKIPETFENTKFVPYTDLIIQKTPCVWFTRDGTTSKIENKSIIMGLKYLGINSKGSMEVTVPKGYFNNKDYLEIEFEGQGWMSLKLIEATITRDGVTTRTQPMWKKLDTVREKELINNKLGVIKKRINLKDLYNKPYNTTLKAFIKGFKSLKKENIASIEITVRQGTFKLNRLKIY